MTKTPEAEAEDYANRYRNDVLMAEWNRIKQAYLDGQAAMNAKMPESVFHQEAGLVSKEFAQLIDLRAQLAKKEALVKMMASALKEAEHELRVIGRLITGDETAADKALDAYRKAIESK
jgi:N-dimethylarginine dimethylaminohydrolase